MIMNIKKPKIPKNISSDLYEDGSELRRGPWTLEEDNLLIQHISYHGEGQWNSLAKCAGLKRTGKSCRLRWLNYLKPDIKRGNLTPHEQLLILELHSRWGNRWSKIAQNLPGRTDNEIKNYWRTRVQKQARQLKVDSNSQKFLEAVRQHWIPRLLEKMVQISSSSSPSSSITTVETQDLTPPSPLFTRLPSPRQKPVTNWKVPEVSGGFTPPGSEACGSFFGVKLPEDECYHVDTPAYGVEPREVSLPECHVADQDWLGQEFGGSFWNSDEWWQCAD